MLQKELINKRRVCHIYILLHRVYLNIGPSTRRLLLRITFTVFSYSLQQLRITEVLYYNIVLDPTNPVVTRVPASLILSLIIHAVQKNKISWK